MRFVKISANGYPIADKRVGQTSSRVNHRPDFSHTPCNMLALSIRQPFADLILRGIKTAEYPTRPTIKVQ